MKKDLQSRCNSHHVNLNQFLTVELPYVPKTINTTSNPMRKFIEHSVNNTTAKFEKNPLIYVTQETWKGMVSEKNCNNEHKVLKRTVK